MSSNSEISDESVSPTPESLDNSSSKQITPSTVKEEVTNMKNLPAVSQSEETQSPGQSPEEEEITNNAEVQNHSAKALDDDSANESSDFSPEVPSPNDEHHESSRSLSAHSSEPSSDSSSNSPSGSEQDASEEEGETDSNKSSNVSEQEVSTKEQETNSTSVESAKGVTKSDEDIQNEESSSEVKKEKHLPAENNDSDQDQTVDVAQFNDVMKMFLTGPLVQDETFNSLEPEQQEYVVLKAYEESTGVKPHIKLNFGATRSYNKSRLRNSDRYQPPVPINPFCLRPNIRKPMSPEEKKAFYEYLEQEDNSNGGKFDDYPIGSRLFIGNLAVNTLKKEDVFRVFHPYGKIVQVNLKQGFGFIQYTNAESCSRAIKGESNVPLHNKFMHLEVSKHQIQKAIERQNVSRSSGGRSRARSRSPSRERDSSANERERSPVRSKRSGPEVKVLLTASSSMEYNDKLLKRLNADGLEVDVEISEKKVDDIPQEQVLDSAYSGVYAVISTCEGDLVNIMVFEKDLDGGIKFDEYTSLSIDAAVELVLSAKAKDFARSAGKNDKSSRRLPASLPKMRPPRTRSPYQHSAGLSEPQSRRRRGGGRERDRDSRYRGGRDSGNRYGGDDYRQQKRGAHTNSSSSSYPSSYYPDQRSQRYPSYNQDNQGQQRRISGNNEYYQQQRQQQSEQRYSSGYHQQQPYSSNNNNNSSIASALQSLQGMNPASMQTMLNLMQQMQQNNSTQQQILQMLQQFQNTSHNSGSNQYMQPQMQQGQNLANVPSQQHQFAQQQMQPPQQLQPQFPPQHVAFNSQFAQQQGQPAQPPQNNAESGNMLANLLGQLQYSAPGSASNHPNAGNNASYSNNDQSSPPKNSKASDQDQTSDLFETLARLKNNM